MVRLFATVVAAFLVTTLSSSVGEAGYPGSMFRDLRHLSQHHFSVQQSNTVSYYSTPAVNDSICRQANFTALATTLYANCSTQLAPHINASLPATLSAHRAAWSAYCAGSCLAAVKAQVVSSIYWKCFQALIRYSLLQALFACNTTDSVGDLCGLAVSRLYFAGACINNNNNKTACVAYGTGACAYNPNRLDGVYCNVNPNATFLTSMCSGCLAWINRNVSVRFPGLDVAVQTLQTSNSMCMTAPSGNYCLAALSNVTLGYTSAVQDVLSSENATAGICADADKVGCFSQIVSQYSFSLISSARNTFVTCAISKSNISATVNSKCLPAFQSAVQPAVELSALAGAMCVTNGNASTHCVPSFSVLKKVVNGTCPTNAATFARSLGCCLGTIQSIMNTVNTSLSDPTLLPPVSGYTTSLNQSFAGPAPPTVQPLTVGSGEQLSPNPGSSGGLYALAGCGVTLNDTLRKRCPMWQYSAAKSLLLRLNYTAIAANATFMATLLTSVRRDVATNAGVSDVQIGFDFFSASNQVQVSGRKMMAQATANGVQYSYTLQASTSAQLQSASSAIDNSVASGYVSLDNTLTTVSGCTSCTGSADASTLTTSVAAVSASTSAPPASPTTPTPGTVNGTTPSAPVTPRPAGATTSGAHSHTRNSLSTLFALLAALLPLLM